MEEASSRGESLAEFSNARIARRIAADMKKRGMRSPDLADAFVLTFACGERRKERYRRPEPRRRSAWAA